MDSVPGRTNETWVRIHKEGVFYGQCSELCGVGHAYMPVAVEVVSKERFAQWAAQAQQKFGKADGSGPEQRLADASPAQIIPSRKD
jgi:cytochrome c oxidase subunit II